MQDRLQASWRYTAREIWRPLFERFETQHPDLPIAVVRTMLVRPQMRPIFVAPEIHATLDAMRSDVATYIDSAADSRAAINRIKPSYFLDGRAVAILLADAAVAFQEYENAELDRTYRARLARFLENHALPYRLDLHPMKLTPLLHGEVDALYRNLRRLAGDNREIREALTAFEDAWDHQSSEWSQITGKAAIRAASLLAENMLIAASDGHANEFTRALNRMRNGNRFPSNDFANIFDRAYTFANTYPNIRHRGDPACQRREIRREDAVLAVLVFISLSACAHDLCRDEA